jgi:thiol-disulfide isomerase/thioredoxin
MGNKKVLLILVLTLVFVLVGATVLYDQLSGMADPEQLTTQRTEPLAPDGTEPSAPDGTEPTRVERPKAPDFTVYDADGKAVKLSDYFGKPIVLNFWASWCGPCKMEMPDFQKKYLELGNEVQFLMVNATGGRETVESAKSFLAGTEYTFPVLFDADADASATYSVYYLPTTYFIDAQGHLVARAISAIDAETLQRGIDMITAS